MKKPERRCILTGDELPSRVMVRFVAGPEECLVPDLAGRLPGRGVWVTSDGALLLKAIEDGALLEAVAAGLNCRIDGRSVSPGLIDQIDKGLTRSCLNLIGLACGAGYLVAGFEKVRAALKSGAARVVVLASDAGPDGQRKMASLVAAGGGTVQQLDYFDRDQLGQAIGRDNTVHAAITNDGFARRISDEALRLAAFRGKALPTIVPDREVAGNERPERAVLEN